jgi:hypothetical protein
VVVFDLPNPEAVQNPDDEGLSITGLESRRDDEPKTVTVSPTSRLPAL